MVLISTSDPHPHRLPVQASKCSDLERLSSSSKGLFTTPRGCCLPFGTMDLAVNAAGAQTVADFKVGQGGVVLTREVTATAKAPSLT